jgi:hypothetical protein
MTEPSPPPPTWIYKRDGALVPFEADKISRSLFAASESLGQPDPFVARELTDGILHFLAGEADGSTPTTAQVAELVVKVVRELGHPALAHTYAAFAEERSPAEQTPSRAALIPSSTPTPLEQISRWIDAGTSPMAVGRSAADACLRDYALQHVFSRDLAAAHRDGLLVLADLEHPLELAASVLGLPTTLDRWFETIEETRTFTGNLLAIDAPEYAVHRLGRGVEGIPSLVRELKIGLRAAGLRAVVNLNSATPPSWAGDLAEGPLFAAQQPDLDRQQLATLSDGLLEELLASTADIRVDWHLNESDFQPAAEARLQRLVRRALEGEALAFVLDRPRRPVALAEGMDRRHLAVLMRVGLDLGRFVDQPGLRANPGLFLQKLGSLARLALSVGTQKRDFLRRHSAGRPALTRGFLLDRARLVVVPVGLDHVTLTMTGGGLSAGGASLDFARQVILTLRQALRQDGAVRHLDACLDSAAGFSLDRSPDESTPTLPLAARAAGLTVWDASASAKQQLRAAGALHAVAEAGTAAVVLADEQALGVDEAAVLLRQARQQTELVRVRFVRPPQTQRQLMASWDG